MLLLFCLFSFISGASRLQTFNSENWANMNLSTLHCVKCSGTLNLLRDNHTNLLQAVRVDPEIPISFVTFCPLSNP